MKKEELLYQNIDQPQKNPLISTNDPAIEPKTASITNLSKFKTLLSDTRMLVLSILILIIIILSLLAVIVKSTQNNTSEIAPTTTTPTKATTSPLPTQIENVSPYQQIITDIESIINSHEKLIPPQIGKELQY